MNKLKTCKFCWPGGLHKQSCIRYSKHWETADMFIVHRNTETFSGCSRIKSGKPLPSSEEKILIFTTCQIRLRMNLFSKFRNPDRLVAFIWDISLPSYHKNESTTSHNPNQPASSCGRLNGKTHWFDDVEEKLITSKVRTMLPVFFVESEFKKNNVICVVIGSFRFYIVRNSPFARSQAQQTAWLRRR